MSAELSEKRSLSLGWLEYAVFKLDGWLRRRQGIYEYTADSRCLFRAELGRADRPVVLADGTRLAAGDPILVLHLWNEHIPAMGLAGPTVAWARQVCRHAHLSLRELARYLQQYPALDIAAICGDMHLGSARQTEQFTRLVSRYGFEAVDDGEAETDGALHRIGKSILVLFLVAATNPVALRSAVFRRFHKRVFMSRAMLVRRYRSGSGVPPPTLR
ncbi:MAG: YkoP family protein [Steroidobacteraceae bacterium]